MSRVAVILFGWTAVAGLADESVSRPAVVQPAALPQAPRAWLGLQVSKPDASMMAQLPGLPPGIGFVVRSVDKGGPAEKAGLTEFDVLWKLGDQMLVNEGQLAALLRLHKPGDEVGFQGFRGGKVMEVAVILGEAPANLRILPDSVVDDTLLASGCNGPMRVINVAEKLASYSTDDGRVEVSRDGETHQVRITGPDGEPIYSGVIPADGSLDGVPESWRRRVYALRRGLNHALEGRLSPVRQPRPRVIPPVEEDP